MIKTKKFKFGIGFTLSLLILSGCSLSKMIQLAEQQNLQVDPNPLEAHGGQVPFTMSADLPPKMLPSGKIWTLKVTYQYADKEFEVGTVEFNADEFPNSSNSNSSKSESFKFPYQDEFNPGKLMIQGVASDPRNGKSKSTPKLQVASGIITTSMAVKDIYLKAYAIHGYNPKEELVPTNMDFYFPQGKSNLVASLSTGGTSNRAKQKDLSAFIAEKNVTRTVTVTGTHSPEGPERINSGLSSSRAERIEKYYRTQMRRYDYKGTADSIKFILKPVIESWTGFRTALNGYDGVSDSQRGQYLAVIDGSGTFEDKAKALSRLPNYDAVFDNVYPGLRSAKTEILTVKPKKTPAEIVVLAQGIAKGTEDADALPPEELLFAATLTPSVDEKIEIYKASVKIEGGWIAYNNLAAAYLEKAMTGGGAMDTLAAGALTQLEIALKKREAPEVYANMASAYMMQKEYDKSYENLNKASEKLPGNALATDINTLKGVIELRRGEYDEAKSSFAAGSTSGVASFDRGLASLLSKDYTAADSFFDGAADEDEDIAADAYYFRAVAAARTDNSANVTEFLQKAVSLDSSLKEKALNDLEFRNYANAVAEAVK